MKEGLVISASWVLLKDSMLATLPILGVEDPKAFYKKAQAIYRREMELLPEYGEGDVLKLNLSQAVMLGAIYEACDPKPDIDTLTCFYHDFLTHSAILRSKMAKRDMLAPREVQRQVAIGERSRRATHPFTWQYSVEVEDADRFTATFTRCGIYDYLKSRGMAHIVPAMCAIDYTMGEISNHLFLRDSTLATGGAVCDCHYVRKSAATEEERAKSQRDKRAEALRGGRTVEDLKGGDSMDLQFGDIQETALVTLAIRASETARENPRIVDVKAAEIIDTLGVDVSKYDPFLSHEGVVARTIMFANTLRGLIVRHPDALCINLGCGFDDKFSQVDNGQIEWYDVDLPDQIAVRRKVYDDRPRCTMLEGDALDGAWTDALPRDRSTTIVVMEGVLEYFTKEQTATCLTMLCDSFEHGYLVAEMNSMFMVKHSKQHDAIKNTNATFKWGTKSGAEFVELEPRLTLVSEHSYNEEMRKHTVRGKLFAATVGRNINNRIAVFQW